MILGLNATKKEVLQIWEDNAKQWHNGCPPLRPSRNDIALYEKLAGEKLRGSVLILGSTPELRDLAAKYKAKTVVVDISQPMFEATSKLLICQGPRSETFIEDDWCAMQLPEFSFSLVLGDAVWWLLSQEKQGVFVRKITSMLSEGGFFVSRFRIWNQNRKNEEPYKIIKKYLQMLRYTPEKRIEIQNAMILHMLDIISDPIAMQSDKKAAAGIMFNFVDSTDPIISPSEKEFITEIAVSWQDRPDFSYQTREQILNCFQGQLILAGEKYARDYLESENFPILAFHKK